MFKFLIFLGVVFFVIPFIFRNVLRLMIGNLMKQTPFANRPAPEQQVRPEGEIKVKYVPKDNKSNDIGGDYIDFEEVKD